MVPFPTKYPGDRNKLWRDISKKEEEYKKKSRKKEENCWGVEESFLKDFYYLIPAESQGTKRGEIEIQK